MYPYLVLHLLDRMADDGGTLPIAHVQSIVSNHSQFDRHDVCLHTGEKKVIICVEKQEIHGGTIHRSILNSILQWRRANQNLVLSISRTFFFRLERTAFLPVSTQLLTSIPAYSRRSLHAHT